MRVRKYVYISAAHKYLSGVYAGVMFRFAVFVLVRFQRFGNVLTHF